MGYLSTVGLISILIGFLVMILRARYRGEMQIRIGFFKGPVWFLLIVFGLFLMILDSILP
jgi:vacuolar-type H+-ATPase subunit I/STV1